MTHPEMAEVTPLIFISGWSSARDISHLFDVVVNVAYDAPVFSEHHFKLVDGPGNDPVLMEAAIAFTARQIHENKRMLIHCAGGRSRSVVVLAAACERELGWPFEQTVERIRQLRLTTTLPMADDQPHKALVELMRRCKTGHEKTAE